MNELQPTEAQLEILRVLWDEQPCTIGHIHERINQQRDDDDEVGYTTVSKQIERMAKSNMLERTKAGKSYVYTSKLKEEETQHQLSNRLLQTAYKGSGIKLALHALGQSKASLEELNALQEWLDQQKKSSDD
ncbi:MAG: BlaI/MecI/CopY family transcriptional regulator [Bacteroidota bacterium]